MKPRILIDLTMREFYNSLKDNFCAGCRSEKKENREMPRKRKFGGLSPNSICLGKSSGPNGIRHPHWVKIYDETNGQKNLRVKPTKFFLLQWFISNFTWIKYMTQRINMLFEKWINKNHYFPYLL